MWLCAEHRLGRVGALKWSSIGAAISALVMAMLTNVTVLFAIMSIVTLFFNGEGKSQFLADTADRQFYCSLPQI